jgi:type II secretory pathway component HofQ
MSPHKRRTLHRTTLVLCVALALALVTVAPAQTQTSPVHITQVTVKIFGDTVQLSVIGTGPLTYKTLQLSNPPRLVIDLPGAIVDPAVPPLMDVDKGGVARVRIGQFGEKPAMVRIAVDLDAPLPFTLATSAPTVLIAKFAARGSMTSAAPAAPVAPAPAPAAGPVAAAPVAQAQQGPPPAPMPVAQASPVTTPGRINLEFRNSELADVLTALAKVCNLNIVTDASVKGTVTVRLLDLTCDEAMRFILEANNLGFRRLGRNLIIMAADKLAPPPEAPEAITYTIGFGSAREVADAIRNSVPGIRVTPEQRSNTIVVVATQAQHEDVRKILAGLDIQLTQVMIETRVVDVNTSTLRNLGLNWGLTATNVFSVQGTFPNQIVVGVATSTINAALDAMVTDKKARVITAPRVAVVDGNEAQINLGEEVPIPSIDASGRLTFTFRPIGVILKILPKVNRDGLITTKVEPEVSAVIEFLNTASGPVPRVSTRKATTMVTVRNGESIVLGGLISAAERRTVIKVPVLGDIPVLGALFRTSTIDRQESEVIFVVTPQIVGGPGGPAPAPSPRP